MIPSMLKDHKKWVCWKKENVKGRITKVPYNPKNGKKTKSTDAQTWSSYEEAVEAKGYDGIGYVFNGDGIFGIDIDHCITSDNKIEKDAALLIENSKATQKKVHQGKESISTVSATPKTWKAEDRESMKCTLPADILPSQEEPYNSPIRSEI